MGATSIFAALAFLFSIAIYVPYTMAVLASSARPTISTWLSWWLMDAAVLAGMLAAGEIAWQLVAYLIGVVFVVGACLYKGAVLGWTRLDSVCLSIVVAAIGLWAISGDPLVAIVLSLVATTVGTVPMLVNVWKEPGREPLLPWLLCLAGGLFGVLAIPGWSLAGALAPVWYLSMQVATVLIIARQFQRPQTNTAA